MGATKLKCQMIPGIPKLWPTTSFYSNALDPPFLQVYSPKVTATHEENVRKSVDFYDWFQEAIGPCCWEGITANYLKGYKLKFWDERSETTLVDRETVILQKISSEIIGYL